MTSYRIAAVAAVSSASATLAAFRGTEALVDESAEASRQSEVDAAREFDDAREVAEVRSQGGRQILES
jgi:hypothetical protein